MLVCALPLLLHTRPRVHRAPGIPHALWFEGGRFMASLEQKSMLRDREPVSQRQPVFRRHRALQYLNVIARSPCDEAIHSYFLACCAMDCFAEPVIGPRFARTRWPAMTLLERHSRRHHPRRRVM